MSKRDEMQISERELSAMTGELHDLHESTFPNVRKAMDHVSANLAELSRGSRSSRRNFLLGAGGVIALGAAAACSNGTSSSSGANSSAAAPTSAGGDTYTGDLKIVALAAALENLAVTAYGGALQAATAGKLGAVPPAVATFVTTAMKQHADHAAAWNSVLTKNNKPPVMDAPLDITQAQVDRLGKAKSVGDVAQQALELEDAAASTYLLAAGAVQDKGGIMVAATIAPVETMHAAILHFVLGQYPVPQTFLGTDKAVGPDHFTGK